MSNWIGSISSDAGNVKKVNQDAVLLDFAESSRYGQIILAVLCDGMGGLSSGELASNTLVKRIETWFHDEFPALLTGDEKTTELDPSHDPANDMWRTIRQDLALVLEEMNGRISDYGNERNIRLGTTIAGLLIINSQWLCMSLGDSRCYQFNDALRLITHDHSIIQQKIDRGELTAEEAMRSPEQSILLQCIGASETIHPDFYLGSSSEKTSFLLCSDGFWRQSSLAELNVLLSPSSVTEEILSRRLQDHISLLKDRGERDNISAIMICTQGES